METKLVIIALLLIAPQCIYSSKKKHIVVIIADDFGFNDVSFRGSNLIPTPNIDALAYSGQILNRYYTLPVCTPARSAFFTGKYPIRDGTEGRPIIAGEPNVGIPVQVKLMPGYLKDSGYSTHLIGKWHEGFEYPQQVPNNRGFDTFFGYYNGFISYYQLDFNQSLPDGSEWKGLDFHDQFTPRFDLQGQYATDLFTQRAKEIIQNHDPDEPLFLCLTQLAVHTGTTSVGDGLEVPPGMDVDELFPYIENEHIRNHAGILKSLDDSVGEVVKELSDSGLLQDSVILFIADNGGFALSSNPKQLPNFASNYPLRGGKHTLYEGGVRGAGLIWSPSLKKGRITESMMHITDWLPTFVEAAGGDAPDDIDGVSQWKLLKSGEDKEEAKRNKILLNIDEVENSEAVIIDGRYKVIKENIQDFANMEKHGVGQFDSLAVPVVTGDVIRNSKVGKIVTDIGFDLSDTNIQSTRAATTLKCVPTEEVVEIGKVLPSKDFLCKDYCVFDIIEDPCELSPTKNAVIIQEAEAYLDQMRTLIKKRVEFKIVDPNANPEKFGGVWSPWNSLIMPIEPSLWGTLNSVLNGIANLFYDFRDESNI